MSKSDDDLGSLQSYLKLIGVATLPAYTSPFDPGYDLVTLESHLDQSHHLMASLKISMACWQIAKEEITRRKIQSAQRFNIPVCAGGGPFEVAVFFNKLPEYIDMCADLGITRIESGEGFAEINLNPRKIIQRAAESGLEVQYEVGEKHSGSFSSEAIDDLIDLSKKWLDAGAKQIIVEAREDAQNVGLFDGKGLFNVRGAEKFVNCLGLENVMFEAPTKSSQFALLNHFGPCIRLCNVRLEELLRVEIYRRGLHSDAFGNKNLRPKG